MILAMTNLIRGHSRRAHFTETLIWQGTALYLGSAIGAALGGALLGRGTATEYLLIAVFFLCAGLSVSLGAHWLVDPRQGVSGSENVGT
jgi:predicted MFS family arabinose efflux permease